MTNQELVKSISSFMNTLPQYHKDLLADALNRYFEQTDQDCGGDERIDACLAWLEVCDESESEGAYYQQMRKENP